MKKYATEIKHGDVYVTEFQWNLVKDSNRLCAYDDFEDALDEAEDLQDIINHYSIIAQC